MYTGGAFGHMLRDTYALSFILACYCFLASFFVVGLFGYHLFLIITAQTTNEQLKKTYPHGSGYQQGLSVCLSLSLSLSLAVRSLISMLSVEISLKCYDYCETLNCPIYHVHTHVYFRFEVIFQNVEPTYPQSQLLS